MGGGDNGSTPSNLVIGSSNGRTPPPRAVKGSKIILLIYIMAVAKTITVDGFELSGDQEGHLRDLIKQKIEVDTLGFDFLKDFIEGVVNDAVGLKEPAHEHEITLWFDTEEDQKRFKKEIENGTAKFVKE